MKRIFSAVLCIVMLLALAVAANADAMNMAGGYVTDITVKKANSAAVVKDGVIGNGEYTEVVINRNADSSDCPLSWVNNVDSLPLIEQAGQFLQNVHFYFSWDDVHGLNIAVKATLIEEVANCVPAQEGNYFENDEFLFQFGMYAALYNVNHEGTNALVYRAVGYNTETKTQLIGSYGQNGLEGASMPEFVPGVNYAASVNGNTYVCEISYPIETFLPVADRNGNVPNEGAQIWLDVSATGGSQGVSNDGAMTYAVSLGDYGFCWNKWQATTPSHAKTYFSHEEIPYSAPTQATTPEATTEPVTQVVTQVVTEEVFVTDAEGNDVTDEAGNKVTEIIEQIVTEIVTVAPSTTPGQGTQAPTTGDPMIIAAVVAAISACGIVVAKKRK